KVSRSVMIVSSVDEQSIAQIGRKRYSVIFVRVYTYRPQASLEMAFRTTAISGSPRKGFATGVRNGSFGTLLNRLTRRMTGLANPLSPAHPGPRTLPDVRSATQTLHPRNDKRMLRILRFRARTEANA